MANAVQLLMQDHRKVEALFDRYQKGDATVVPQVCNELKVHTSIEEQVLYPALDDVSGGEKLRQEAEREHQEVKDAIAEIEGSGADSPQAVTAMRKVIEGVMHHVQEEENDVFPKMQKELGGERLTALGERLLTAKRHQAVATGTIIDLTKEELYELAQGADIEGRSDMTKEQLIEALRS
jgi:hemerythrin superfamily protein